MKKSLLAFFPLALPAAFAQLPAFPGAEGYGAYATGGRGTGDVYTVTNLNGSGPGSLAEGIATAPSGGRTIVFAVSGYIPLPGSNLRITRSKITIAGQTAPGDGIGLRNGTFRISGDDIVIRHLRFRHGRNGSGGDCVNLDSGSQNTILDHVSLAFSTDENISSFNSPPDRLTMQWALNGWGLESHSCGGLWDQNQASCHHTLWSHNHTRNPKARPSGLLEWVNNVTFDWDIGFIMGDSQTPAQWKANVIGNYFVCPPGNLRNSPLEKASLDRHGYPNFSVHVASNLHDRDGDGLLNGIDRGWSIVSGSAYHATANPTGNYLQSLQPHAAAGSAPITIDPPLLAWKKIVSAAGPLRLDAQGNRPLRDEVDTRMIENLVTQTRNHITRESNLAGISNAGFGTLASDPAPIDSDRDGMPDAYELATGGNPAVQDHNSLVSGTTFFPPGTPSGYTRLEEYLHFKAIPHTTLARNTGVSIDLRRYTQGFLNQPSFSISQVSGGSVTTSGPGNHLVQFQAADLTGRAGFDFTVTDADGFSWTRRFAICLTQSGAPTDLRWSGQGDRWDTSSLHWLKDQFPSVFTAGDRVTFDDQGASQPNLTIANPVVASSILVDSAASYTWSGDQSVGSLSPLIKRGSGALTIGNTASNGFPSISLESGTLSLTQAGASGNAPIDARGGSLRLSPASNQFIGSPLRVQDPTEITVASQHTFGGAWSGNQPVTVHATGGQLWTIGGDWNAFTGTLVAGSGNPRFRINGNSNLNFGNAAATVDLGSGSAQLMNRNGTTATSISFGNLVGASHDTILSGSQTGTAASTYRIGALGGTAIFDGSIRDGGGPTHLQKTGSGTWILRGASTHSGTTTIESGTLRLLGSFANSPVTVQSGAILAGTGTASAAVSAPSGAILDPGSSPGAIGTLTCANGLALNGSILRFDLSDQPSGSNDRISVTGGNLSLAGSLRFRIHPSAGTLGSGSYELLGGGGHLTASSPALVLEGIPSQTRQTFSLQRSANNTPGGNVRLLVSGTAPASLTFSGQSTGGIWDLQQTPHFTGGPSNTFYNWDSVRFDDSAQTSQVTLSGILEPRTVIIQSASRSFTWNGNGSLAGGASLIHQGSTPLTLAPAIVTATVTPTSGSNTATVDDATGLAPSMAILGAGFPYGTTIASISGNTLTLSQPSTSSTTATATFHARHSYSGGTYLHPGSEIRLANEAAQRWGLGTGPVFFQGGTLRLYDSGAGLPGAGDFPSPLHVAAAQSGTLVTPQRGSLSGPLTGEGHLFLQVRYVRGDFHGDWSGFTGRISVSTNGYGEFRMAKNYNPEGFPDAWLDLAPDVTMKPTGILSQGAGTTIEIGHLTGSAGSSLLGGVTAGRALTYRIGGRNESGTYAGTIGEQTPGSTFTSIVKTGSGTWTLAGASQWSGGTRVEGGTLHLTQPLQCGGAFEILPFATFRLDPQASLQSDSLIVAPDASFTGSGSIHSDLTLQGLYRRTGPDHSTLRIHGSLFTSDSAILELAVSSSGHDRLEIEGDAFLAGTLRIVPDGPMPAFGRYPLLDFSGQLEGLPALELPQGFPSAHLSISSPGRLLLVVDDSDEDGLPDSWEISSLGSLQYGPEDDPDLDGSSNLVEWRLGLNPLNGSSRWTLSIETSPQTSLLWQSPAGLPIRVERSVDLLQWQPLADITSSEGTNRWTDPSPPAGRAYYRLRLLP